MSLAHRRLLLPALCLCLLGAGCQDDYSDIRYDRPADPDDGFARGRDRPPSARTLYALACVLASQHRDAEYARVLADVIRRYPDFLPAYCDLASCHLRNQRVDEAMHVLALGLRIAPRDPVLLNDMGMCYLLRGQAREALEFFTTAAAAMPRDVRYRCNMAVALGLLNRYDEAVALYRQALPPEAVAHNLAILRRAREVAPPPGPP